MGVYERVSQLGTGNYSPEDFEVMDTKAERGFNQALGYDLTVVLMPNACPSWFYEGGCGGACTQTHGRRWRAIFRRKNTNETFAFIFWQHPTLKTHKPGAYAIAYMLNRMNRDIGTGATVQDTINQMGFRNNDHARRVARNVITTLSNIRSFFSEDIDSGNLERIARGMTIHAG